MTSAKTVAAIEKLARSDPKHATCQSSSTPTLLVQHTRRDGGPADRRTSPPSAGRPVTKMAAVTPDHETDDSTWFRFLADITAGDKAIVDYLQRLFGYCLSADVRDHVVVFFYGTGANGKSTLIDLVLHIFGDYGKLIATETLMESRGERHPTDIAT